MKSLKKYFIGIAMLIFSGAKNFIVAQTEIIQYAICENCNGNNPTMGDPITYTIDQVSSDFGMRVAGGGTRFHRGIDYVPPANAAVLAVRGGTITNIDGTGLKSITIRHADGTYYAYLHIFDENVIGNYSRSGAFVLHVISGTNRHAILNLASGNAYCHDPDDVGKTITYNSRQFRLTNIVQQAEEAIAPVGTSSNGDPFPYHLHISSIEAGVIGGNIFNSQTHSIDPWTSIISRPTTLVPRLRTRKPQNYSGNTSDHNRGADNWGEIDLVYPDKSKGKRDNPLGRNVIQVEVAMQNATRGGRDDRYTDVVMDANLIQVQLKKEHESNWNEIEGLNYQSHIRINPQGTETIYPSRINGNYGSLDSTGTGIVPFAYRTAGDNITTESGAFAGRFNPWDYYIFPDFYPRIIKGHTPNVTAKVKLADSPSNAKYADGKYKIRSRVENIHGNEFLSGELDITLDNFQPFITDFQFKVGSDPGTSTVFYEIERKQNEGDADKIDDGYVTNEEHYYKIGQPSPSSKYYIEIRTSEPVQELKYKVRKNTGNFPANSTPMNRMDNTYMFWRVQLSAIYYPDPQDELEFEITAKDMSNNELVNIADMSKLSVDYNLPGYKINVPTRINNQRTNLAWNNYPSKKGLDRFKVKMSGCQRSSSQVICDAIKLMEASKARYDCTSVRLNLENYVPTAEVTWTNENGDEISYNPFIIVSSAGRYCYKILGEFGDDCCSKEGCIFVLADDFEDKSIEITSIIDPGCGSIGNKRGHVLLDVNNSPSGTMYSWSHNPGWNVRWARVEPGQHSVTVTMPWGCKRSLNYTVENAETVVQVYDEIIPSDCSQNNGEIHIITNLYGEENAYLGVLWSNGSTERSLYSLSPGQYCVTVTHVNTECPIIKCYSVPEKNLELSASITPNTNCANGNHNGVISLDILNGTPPYTVAWADNSSDLERINLKTGPYLVTVTDANGCRTSNLYNVPGTQPMSMTGTVGQDCATKLYKIRLTNFPTNLVYLVILYKMEYGVKELINYYAAYNGYEITDLTHGEYIIESSDLNCSFTSLNFSLPEPFTYFNMEIQENMGCIAGREDGEVTVYFEGGLRPLTVSLGNQSQTVQGNSVTFGNLNGGFHMINFVNSSGCTNWIPTYIPYPIINIEGTVVHANGPNHNPPPSNGSISLNITGGSQQFNFEWYKNNNLISTTKDIMDLASGNYIVKVFDLITGCEISKSFNINQNICKRQLGVQFYSTRIECSSGGNTDYSNCSTGCPKDISFNIWSALNNQSNFLFPIIVTISHPNGFILNDIVNSVDQQGFVWFHVSNIPVNLTPYTISIVDNCGNTASTQFNTCARCEDIERDSYYNFKIVDNPGTIKFVLNRACKYHNSIWSKDSRIEINEKSLGTGQEYKITWIDGHTETIVYRKESRTKFKKGKKKYKFKEHQFDGGIKTVTVERNDGCIRNFSFRLGDVIKSVGVIHHNIEELPVFSYANIVCENCNTFIERPLQLSYKNSLECVDKTWNNTHKYFHYIPNNFGNPCIGGKLIRHLPTSTGVDLNKEVITSENDFLNQLVWRPRPGHDYEQNLYRDENNNILELLDAGGCEFDKIRMYNGAANLKNMYVNWFRLVRILLHQNESQLPCGKILQIQNKNDNFEILLDPGNSGSRFVIKDEFENVIQDSPIGYLGKNYRYVFNPESYFGKNFIFILKNSNCPDDTKKLNSCPWSFSITPEDFDDKSEDIRFNCFSPNQQIRYLYIYSSNDLNNPIHSEVIPLNQGENIVEIAPNPFIGLPSGDYVFELAATSECPTLSKTYSVNNFTVEEDNPNFNCLDKVIEVGYDSIKNEFNYFIGKIGIDSVIGQTFTFDTLSGYFNEFTRHHIEWDWVKHVRYDSLKTVYYFGTDDTLRSFVTAIDSNGVSHTTWFYDIVFQSCGPLNQQGIWTLIGYKVSEQKYYMYQYDKVNLTALPLIIPNDNRGQTYTAVWNFGPDEYATKIVSGTFEIVKFSSLTYPPFEVSLPRPFKVKTVNKWGSNQWLVSGDLNGSITIAGDTLVSEEWTKSLFIWYDWQGTVIRYKVIEKEEDRIITRVATDGYKHIFFAGVEIDTLYHENPDSLQVEHCIFGDTISVESLPVSFKASSQDQTTSVEGVLPHDNTIVRFYPNPFKSGINLSIDSSMPDEISVRVFNMVSEEVFKRDILVMNGRNETYLHEFETLPGGLYTVWIFKSSGKQVFKVIKIE